MELSVVGMQMRQNCVLVEKIDQVLSVWNKAARAQNWALGNAAVDREIRRLPDSVDEWLGPVGRIRYEPAESRRVYGEPLG